MSSRIFPEKTIVAALKEYFSQRGYECFINPIVIVNGKLEQIDLVCKKDEENIYIEIKTTPIIHVNFIKELIFKKINSSIIPDSFILCIGPDTKFSSGSRKLAIENGITIMKYYYDGSIETYKSAILEEDVWINSVSSPLSSEFLDMMYEYKKTQVQKTYDLRVSRKILDLIPTLNNVEYSNILKNFKKEYEKINDVGSENKIILDTLDKLWSNLYGKSGSVKSFFMFEEFEPILKQIPFYRDHFIHTFQVFLMGSIIIDEYYEIISKKYRNKINNCENNSLDFSWLLSSTFHDFCYPIQKYDEFNKKFFEKFLESDKRPIKLELDQIIFESEQLKYIDQLTSLYCHLNNTSNENEWQYDQSCQIDDSIRSIFLNNFLAGNHGILSAVTLIKKIKKEDFVINQNQDYTQGKFSTDIYPAALSIGLHDKNVFSVLNNEISFEKNPLSFLLIYCDTAQEWGRLEQHELAKVGNFNLEDNNIDITIIYENKEDFDYKTNEIINVFNNIRSTELCFSIKVRSKGSVHSESSCKNNHN